MVDGEQARAARDDAFARQGDAEQAQHLRRPPSDALLARRGIELGKDEQSDRQAVQAVADRAQQAHHRAQPPSHCDASFGPGGPHRAATCQSAAW
jgi:hypothetical protein